MLSLQTLIQPAFANPIPKDDLHDTLSYGFLQDPICASYCGVENELCCSGNEVCMTADSTPACVGVTVATQEAIIYPRQDNGWSLYTSTYTVTSTYTTTGSSQLSAATGTCVPDSANGESACGPICCASDQTCAYSGQCTAVAGAGGAGGVSATAVTTAWSTYQTTMTTAGSTITTQFSAPYRVTGTGTPTNTATIESATTTGSGNGTAVAGGTGGSLSGGAIAGIVIGVLVGVVLLLALCACCVMRGLWHGLLAIFGLGSKKKKRSSSRDRETVIIEEERYSRRGSNSHAARNSHGSWFARNPARSAAGESRRTSEKVKAKDDTKASWAGAGALGTLMLLLGLRRDKKRRGDSTAAKRSSRSRPRPRSNVSSSYFSNSYTASSPSEFSSDYTYSSVYTPVQSQHPRRASRPPSVVRSPVRTQSVARSASRGAGGGARAVYRDEYEPMTKPPPDYAGSESSGGRTRDTRRSRSRRTETTRMSRAQSRR